MYISENYNYIDPISAQFFTPQQIESVEKAPAQDSVSISEDAQVLFASSQSTQQGSNSEQGSQQQSTKESYAATEFKKALDWNSVNALDDEGLTEEEKQRLIEELKRKIEEETRKKQTEAIDNSESTEVAMQEVATKGANAIDNSSILDALGTTVAYDGETNDTNSFVTNVAANNTAYMGELAGSGEAGNGLGMQALSINTNNAWSAYSQAMNNFDLQGTMEFSQGQDFVQWRAENPVLAQKLEIRSGLIFDQMV